jgi:thiosulfate/3-mercaptopyruvate sulfurtransferase
MKRKLFFISLMLLFTLIIAVTKLHAQRTPAIVSTQWLEENIDGPNLVILDVREPESYAAGHIPGSVNIPAPNWYINSPGGKLPWMELPEKEDLFATIGKAGITINSIVVVIARTSDSPTGELAVYSLTKASRAAITLIYAGINTVTMLNGGYDKWTTEGRLISTEPVIKQATTYIGNVTDTVFISTEYVKNKVGKSTIIDTRNTDQYFGIQQDFSSKRAGHIPTAKNLPAPWFWQTTKVENGESSYITWKDNDEIKEIALTVLGENMEEEIIDYCGVGGYASHLWFLLTQVVGYTNVKFYDGSMQEWTSDPDAPVTKYKYE